MLIDWILVLTGLVFVIAASLFDIFSRTREVPDWLNYCFIACGLGIRGIYSLIIKDYWFILYGLIGLGIFFIIANLMYYTKQWGGGDCKLLMGLGTMFGSYPAIELFNPQIDAPFLAILFINILIAGAIYGLIFSLVIAIKKWKQIKLKSIDKILFFVGLILGALIILLSILLLKVRVLTNLGIILGILVFLSLSLVRLIKKVEKYCMYHWKKIKDLTEGDWLVEDAKANGKIIVSSKIIGLEKKDIAKLSKNKIKTVLIKEGIPFVPAFLIGIILTFIFGDVLTILLL